MMHEQMQVMFESFDRTCKTPLANPSALAEEQHEVNNAVEEEKPKIVKEGCAERETCHRVKDQSDTLTGSWMCQLMQRHSDSAENVVTSRSLRVTSSTRPMSQWCCREDCDTPRRTSLAYCSKRRDPT